MIHRYLTVSFIDTIMVRSYILTNKERIIVDTYLKTGDKLDGFRLIKSRLVNLDLSQVEEDKQLIKQFLSKI